MDHKKLTGPEAGPLKYDLLTALGAAGLHGSPSLQTSAMRLNLLITARYNWRLDEVSVGHTELARLWDVNERTVKREMKRLISLGMIICKRPGVRGRVGAYRLNYEGIYDLSRPSWAKIGSDFADRMAHMQPPKTVVRVDFSSRNPVEPRSDAKPGTWSAVQRRLKHDHTALYDSWFSKLTQTTQDDVQLILEAPNRFVAEYIETHLSAKLSAAVKSEIGASTRVSLTVAS